MKKLALLFSFFTLFTLFSCSNNDYVLANKDTIYIGYLTFGDVLHMKEIYANDAKEFFQTDDPFNDIRFEGYYGTYFIDDHQKEISVVSFIPIGFSYTADVKHVEIGGYNLAYPTLIPNLFYNDKFYSLEEAYESSLLPKDVLEVLKYQDNMLLP